MTNKASTFVKRMTTIYLLISTFFVFTFSIAYADTTKNEFYIDSSAEQGAKIYVRERHRAELEPAQIDKTILFVHGATYSGATFDMEVEGYDWMKQVADQGYAAYYLDIRGYGNSTRPAAMKTDPSENPPFSRATDAVKDIADVVAFILERTAAEKINLVGWSWGTVTSGMYTTQNNDKVERLVLYAPVYNYKHEAITKALSNPDDASKLADLGAYRKADEERTRVRWDRQILPEDKSEWREENVFDAWYKAISASEPEGVIHAPNGTLVDLWEIFNERPLYDAAAITVPTLVIRGSNDPTATREDSLGLYDKLSSTVKHYVEIGHASHFASLERTAPQLIGEVQNFLE